MALSTAGPSSSLTPSSRLGPYEITAPLGAGGMGEVAVAAEAAWIAEGGSRAGLPGIVATRRRMREGTAWATAALAALAAPPVEKGASFTTGTSQPLFQARFAPIIARSLYRASPDGQRFLVTAIGSGEVTPPAVVVLNWASALESPSR
jgi:hypothetical protein